jgi:hypothetical protein
MRTQIREELIIKFLWGSKRSVWRWGYLSYIWRVRRSSCASELRKAPQSDEIA